MVGVVLQSIGSVDGVITDADMIPATMLGITGITKGSFTTFVSDTKEFITGPADGCGKPSAPITVEQTSARACR